MAIDDNSGRAPFDVLTELPAVITAATAVAVLLSVSKQLGFFMTLDSSLISLLSIQNIVENSLTNLPTALLAMVLPRVVRSVRPDPPEPGPRLVAWLTAIYRPFNRSDVFPLIFFPLMAILFLPQWGTTLEFLLAISVWTSVLGWTYTKPHLRETPYFDEMLSVAFFAVLWFLGGIGEAQQLSRVPNHVVRHDGADFRMNLARTSSDFFIGLDGSGKLVAIPRDGSIITRIAAKSDAPLLQWYDAWDFFRGSFGGLHKIRDKPLPIWVRWPDGRP